MDTGAQLRPATKRWLRHTSFITKQHEDHQKLSQTVLDYKDVIDNYLKVNDWRVKENSTVTYSVGGLILSNSGAVTANYWLSEVYDKGDRGCPQECGKSPSITSPRAQRLLRGWS